MFRNFLKATAAVLVLGLAVTSAHADEGISIANGKAKFNALGQFWLVNDTSLGSQTLNGQENGAKFDMYVRRAEMQFSGGLSDNTHWMLMIDPARALSVNGAHASILQDLAVSYNFMPSLELTVGQFKTLTVAESLDPDGELLFPERSMVARTWGESRQPGAMIVYKADMWKVAGMISNNTNSLGNNTAIESGLAAVDYGNSSHPNNKDLTFRFDAKPVDMASLGAFVYLPQYNWGQGGAFGGNIRGTPMEDVLVRVEYVRGWVRSGADTLARNGYVVDAGYQYGDFQPVARYEIQQQGATVGTETTGSAITFGLNYYMMKHTSKVQFAYSILGDNTSGSNVAAGNLAAGTNGSPATGQYAPQKGTGGGLATLAFQFAI